MNIFGSATTKKSEYYTQLASAYKDMEEDKITTEDFNKILLLTIGSHFENPADVLSTYAKERWAAVDSHSIPSGYAPSTVREVHYLYTNNGINQRIPMIKEVRSVLGIGLREAKELVEDVFSFDGATITGCL